MPDKLAMSTHCHLHAAWNWVLYFLDMTWGSAVTAAFSENFQNGKLKGLKLLDPISKVALLLSSLQSQPGLRFRPLLLNGDQAAREELIQYVIGLGAAPTGYEVSQHLLERPSQPLEMSMYLDPTYICTLDILCILRSGLPSVNKTFRLRYNSGSSKFYQHRTDNIRLVSPVYNMAKGKDLTVHIADVMEYSIFLYHTALQVLGNNATFTLLDRISDLLHAAYEEGHTNQLDSSSPAKAFEDFAVILSPKVIAEVHPGLSQHAVVETTCGILKIRQQECKL